MSHNSYPTDQEALTDGPERFHVEHLSVGQTDYTVLLFEHSEDFATAMENTLQDCEVIAVEQPGHNGDKKRRNHDSAPTADIALQESVDRLAQKSRGMIAIDIHQDDPQFPKVVEAQAALRTFSNSLASLDPLEQTRKLFNESVTATAASYEARDGVLHQQLTEQLPAVTGQATVGVALGSMHYRALRGIDPSHDNDALRQKVHATLSPHEIAIEEVRDTGNMSAATADRGLLSMYMMCFGISTKGPDGQDLIAKLDPSLTENVLNAIDRFNAPDIAYSERCQQIESYLRATNDMLTSAY